MKILIVHDKFLLEAGGCEKICTFLANSFTLGGNEVEILTYEDTQSLSVYQPLPEVKITNLFHEVDLGLKALVNIPKYKGKNPFAWLSYKIKKKFTKFSNKKMLKNIGGEDELYRYNLSCKANMWNDYILKVKPDIIITLYLGMALETLYNKKHNVPVINSVNGRPDFDFTEILWRKNKLEMSLLKNCYQQLSGYQLLLSSYIPYLPKEKGGRCEVIGNPITQINTSDIINHELKKDRYIISHVGSLVLDHKQQHIAINAFASVADTFPNWDMYFYGKGPDRSFLENLIQELNLQKRVFLKGFISNPTNELKKTDLFIFPSKYEGFPLALTEAMSIGLPCLGFSNCTGVNELIKHGESGFLAENNIELENFLKQLMTSSELRSKMGYFGHKMTAEFTPEKIIEKWSLLINNV